MPAKPTAIECLFNSILGKIILPIVINDFHLIAQCFEKSLGGISLEA